ncbi:hypothetical protein NQ315_008056 [Exocentrus adspersus]|uniref:Uncharacterized protein n=1 Tax=Exocentrus adspersus TaxID=1586481 RepID=A0AAV8VVG7_9CUCU|nr:hypothetical protein NQ315_008056 [Exocentrus adspersus]
MSITSKQQIKRYGSITGRVLEKRRTESETSNQTLRTFSVTYSDIQEVPKFFNGGSIPNSTARRALKNKIIDADQEVKVKGSRNIHKESSVTASVESAFQAENSTDEDDAFNSCSIVSGNETLRELRKLHKMLHKNYEPKQQFAPRRSTLESIKSAIEKAKQEVETNQNVVMNDVESTTGGNEACAYPGNVTKENLAKNKKTKESRASPRRNASKTEKSVKIREPGSCVDGTPKRTKGQGATQGGRLSHEPIAAPLMDLPKTVQVFFSVGPRHETALFRSDTPVDQIKVYSISSRT